MRKNLTNQMKALAFAAFALLLCVTMGQGSVTAQAAPKFKVSTSTMKKNISGYMVPVTVNGAEQRFAIKKSEITKISVTSKSYSASKRTETVKANVYVNRKVATVKARVKMTYRYSNGKWKFKSAAVSSSAITKINLKGTWKGTYVAAQGITALVLRINSVSKDGYILDGTFNFSAYSTNPNVPSGSYSLKGGYDLNTGKVAIYGNEWIERPDGYNFADMNAYVDLENEKLKSAEYSSDYSLNIKKK